MATNKETTSTSTRTVTYKARVSQWWMLQDAGPSNSVTIAVRLCDSRSGFLKAILDRAFDGSDHWCELDVIGEGQTHYTASLIELPLGLRQLITGVALRYQVDGLFYNVESELFSATPCFATYVEASAMLREGIDANSLDDFVKCINDPEAVGCTDESDIEIMKRLVDVCRKLMPQGNGAKLSLRSCGRD